MFFLNADAGHELPTPGIEKPFQNRSQNKKVTLGQEW